MRPEGHRKMRAELEPAVEFDRRSGAITAVRVGGAAVMVAEGILTL